MQVSDVSHHSPLGKSDHSVITFNYHCYLDCAKPTDRYNYRKANFNGMKQHLENSNWNCNFVENAKNKAVEEVCTTELRNTNLGKVDSYPSSG